MTALLALPHVPIYEAVERRALDAQRQLARAGHHRLPPVDLLVATLADRHWLGVLHYDRDYDLLADKTDRDFVSVWLAPAGTISAARPVHPRRQLCPFRVPQAPQTAL